jgi:hypothetical protein
MVGGRYWSALQGEVPISGFILDVATKSKMNLAEIAKIQPISQNRM